MYRISYTSPSGRTWKLESGKNRGIFLAPEGITGMSGDADDNALTSVGIPGQQFSTLTIKPLTGVLTTTIVPTEDTTIAQLLARWRTDWSRTTPGTLTIAAPTGVLTTKVRLAAAIDPPKKQPNKAKTLSITTQITADSGLWKTQPTTHHGTATIHNPGDVITWPTIAWTQSDTLTLPSGATITLPEATTQKILSLNPIDSRIVTNTDGTPDQETWQKVAPGLIPEGIPPGQYRTFKVTKTTTSITCSCFFLDPWR